jgi:glycosyltransferase involved in cell wall biosynthesis
LSRQLSIVIPVGPGDKSWKHLLDRLHKITPKKLSCEVLLSACQEDRQFDGDFLAKFEGKKHVKVHLIAGTHGRARQLNRAIAKLKTEFVWVLHADSEISSDHFEEILAAMHSCGECLYYFPLGFFQPSHMLLRLNALGANLRSRFGIPFGDQGFFFKVKTWCKVGGFSESASYGEDHLFVWQCHRHNVPLFAFKSTLYTSPRRYEEHGWLKTTVKFAYLTWLQALPEGIKLLRSKISKRNLSL